MPSVSRSAGSAEATLDALHDAGLAVCMLGRSRWQLLAPQNAPGSEAAWEAGARAAAQQEPVVDATPLVGHADAPAPSAVGLAIDGAVSGRIDALLAVAAAEGAFGTRAPGAGSEADSLTTDGGKHTHPRVGSIAHVPPIATRHGVRGVAPRPIVARVSGGGARGAAPRASATGGGADAFPATLGASDVLAMPEALRHAAVCAKLRRCWSAWDVHPPELPFWWTQRGEGAGVRGNVHGPGREPQAPDAARTAAQLDPESLRASGVGDGDIAAAQGALTALGCPPGVPVGPMALLSLVTAATDVSLLLRDVERAMARELERLQRATSIVDGVAAAAPDVAAGRGTMPHEEPGIPPHTAAAARRVGADRVPTPPAPGAATLDEALDYLAHCRQRRGADPSGREGGLSDAQALTLQRWQGRDEVAQFLATIPLSRGRAVSVGAALSVTCVDAARCERPGLIPDVMVAEQLLRTLLYAESHPEHYVVALEAEPLWAGPAGAAAPKDPRLWRTAGDAADDASPGGKHAFRQATLATCQWCAAASGHAVAGAEPRGGEGGGGASPPPASSLDALGEESYDHATLFPRVPGADGGALDRCCGKHGQLMRYRLRLRVELLHAEVTFGELAREARSVVLASGTLAPMRGMASELGREFSARMEPSVEALHVIDYASQLRLLAVKRVSSSAAPLRGTQAGRGTGYHVSVGLSLLGLCQHCPGGMIAFVPSYSLLEEMTATWHRTRIAQAHLPIVGASPHGTCPLLGLTLQDAISALMPCVVYEPRGGGREAFDCARRDFARGVEEHGRALLVAVYRGKMSEGLNFADDLAVRAALPPLCLAPACATSLAGSGDGPSVHPSSVTPPPLAALRRRCRNSLPELACA